MLGWFVSHRPPGALDVAAHDAVYGHALPVAAFFTQSGRFPAYAVLCAISLAFGIVRRAWFWRALIAVVVLAGAWKVSDLYKDHFMRARPLGQLVFHEPSFSYASGHATLALTFYGAWALYAWRSDLGLPLRRTLVAIAALAILAIGWSRLALGAHYLTDVIGGYLLGATFLCILAAATRSIAPSTQHNPFARRPRSRRSPDASAAVSRSLVERHPSPPLVTLSRSKGACGSHTFRPLRAARRDRRAISLRASGRITIAHLRGERFIGW